MRNSEEMDLQIFEIFLTSQRSYVLQVIEISARISLSLTGPTFQYFGEISDVFLSLSLGLRDLSPNIIYLSWVKLNYFNLTKNDLQSIAWIYR